MTINFDCQLCSQEVLQLGLPQWLSLTDAEDMVAKHVAAELKKEEELVEAANLEDELLAGELCKVPPLGSAETARMMELELDLDCWKVLPKP